MFVFHIYAYRIIYMESLLRPTTTWWCASSISMCLSFPFFRRTRPHPSPPPRTECIRPSLLSVSPHSLLRCLDRNRDVDLRQSAAQPMLYAWTCSFCTQLTYLCIFSQRFEVILSAARPRAHSFLLAVGRKKKEDNNSYTYKW